MRDPPGRWTGYSHSGQAPYEGKFGACADDEEVVIAPLAVLQFDAVFGGAKPFVATGMKRIFRFAKVRVRSISASSRLGQFTATWGLTGRSDPRLLADDGKLVARRLFAVLRPGIEAMMVLMRLKTTLPLLPLLPHPGQACRAG